MSELLKENRQLMQEYDFEKNKGIDLEKLTLGSNKKVWWKCPKGHEWELSVKYKKISSQCPFCSGKKVLTGYNDLATINPGLTMEWDYKKNGNLKPTQVSSGSEKKVWWRCTKGHEWQAIIGNRNKGVGCPVCAGKTVLIGYNDLATTNPELAKEWNYEKNGNIKPTDVTAGSNKKIWWKCEKGHEWIVAVKSRNSGNNCPYCSNKNVLAGYNDLATTNPELAEEWNYEKNGDLTPTMILKGSSKIVWWKCEKGHEWKAEIGSRAQGKNCPYCSNNKVLSGFNDLATTHPEIAKEWDYDKNTKKPDEVMAGSNIKKYWFICPKGHSYETTLLGRAHGTNCPVCAKEKHTSFPEKAIFYYLKKHCENVKENYHDSILGAKEIDIYLPDLKFGIEYDGRAWHGNVKRDIEKDNKCYENRIVLLRVREIGCAEYKSNSIKIYVEPYNMTELNSAIEYIFNYLKENYSLRSRVDIDVDRDRMSINELMNLSEKENSIASYCPEIKTFWNYEKNGKIAPEQIPYGSEKRVFLKCNLGHEWEVMVNNFPSHPWCPYCSGRRVLSGFNDLFATNPELIPLWSKHNTIDPTKIKKGCNSKALWYCPKCNSEYEMSVNDKTNGYGCPYCSGHRVLKGYNDLESMAPELLQDWNYKKNSPLMPNQIAKKSNKKVWWKCHVCNYEWQTKVCNRTKEKPTGCPKCGRVRSTASTSKSVMQYSLDGKLVAEYNSVMEAERTTEIKCISRVCRGERKTAGGFIWKYKGDDS